MATDPTAHGRVLRPDPNQDTAARGRCGRSPTGAHRSCNRGRWVGRKRKSSADGEKHEEDECCAKEGDEHDLLAFF